MKYTATVSRTHNIEVVIFATSPEDALKHARELHPGYTTDDVMELGDEDEPGRVHSAYGACENCDCIIWMGDDVFRTTEDDVLICGPCANVLERAEVQP